MFSPSTALPETLLGDNAKKALKYATLAQQVSGHEALLVVHKTEEELISKREIGKLKAQFAAEQARQRTADHVPPDGPAV